MYCCKGSEGFYENHINESFHSARTVYSCGETFY